VLDLIQTLDPERDCERIVRLSGQWDFAWDGRQSLRLALFRTFAVPSIGGLLFRTGEFTQRSQKRNDDTELLIAEFVEHGFGSERGSRAIARMNAIHERFRIRNEDFLYVLSTFVCEPSRWNARFGWRPISAIERRAGFLFWREVGERMGIAGIPDSADELTAFNVAYEAEHFRYTAANAAVARATLELFASWYLPRPLWPLGIRAACALLDEPLLDALGLPHPRAEERRMVEGVLRVRARVLPHLPPRRHPYGITGQPNVSYPEGYQIEALGPLETGAVA
jgi:hypothetical protein